MDEFIRTLNSSLKLTLFICLPAAAGLIALSEPMVQVLFGRGAFTMEAVRATAWALVAYGVGLPAFACVRPLYAAYFALSDTKTPAWTATACLVIYAAVGWSLMGPMRHVGLALATSISSWVNVLVLGLVLRRKLGPWLDIAKNVAVSALLSALIGLGAYATAPHASLSLALIALWAPAYLVAGRLLRVEEAMLLTDFLWRRIGPRLRRK